MTRTDAAEAVAYKLFRTPEGRVDPYPLYHELRRVAPVHYSEAAQGWVLTRYDDCNSALRDPRFVRAYAESMDARSSSWRERPALAAGERLLLNMDGPDHTRLRKLVVKAFTPRTVDRLRPAIGAMVAELLDGLADSGAECDLMEGLAFQLPVRVIGELLGVPEEDRPQFRELVRSLTAVFEVGAGRAELDAADEAQGAVDAYFLRLIAAKRASASDDLLSHLIAVDDAGDRLTDDELCSLASLVFIAGFETTTNLIGNGMLALLRHPDQLALLRAQPELFANLPDELLRYDGTVQVTARFTTEPVDVGGVVIGAGEAVFPLVGAGNRDPGRYPDPDRLDMTRTDIRPLTFGGGVHFCLGAALARAETDIVFRNLVDRFDDFELAGLAPFRDRLTIRGPAVLPLAMRPRERAPAHAGAAPLPARPAGDDAEWRAAFRERTEDAPPADDDELAARVALLGRVPLFQSCTLDELAELAATAYPMAFDAGEVVCAEGAEATDCYVIAAGEATATREGRVLAVVAADDVVGERGPLLGSRRAATVTATSHLLTYAISRDRLRRLAAGRPELGASMRDQIEQRYRSDAGV